jgi:hypothetical protein
VLVIMLVIIIVIMLFIIIIRFYCGSLQRNSPAFVCPTKQRTGEFLEHEVFLSTVFMCLGLNNAVHQVLDHTSARKFRTVANLG